MVGTLDLMMYLEIGLVGTPGLMERQEIPEIDLFLQEESLLHPQQERERLNQAWKYLGIRRKLDPKLQRE